jgi:hypothetical protein
MKGQGSLIIDKPIDDCASIPQEGIADAGHDLRFSRSRRLGSGWVLPWVLALLLLVPRLYFGNVFRSPDSLEDLITTIRPVFLVWDRQNRLPALVNETDLGMLADRPVWRFALLQPGFPATRLPRRIRAGIHYANRRWDLQFDPAQPGRERVSLHEYLDEAFALIASGPAARSELFRELKHQKPDPMATVSLSINNFPKREVFRQDLSNDSRGLLGWPPSAFREGIRICGDHRFEVFKLPGGEVGVLIQVWIGRGPGRWRTFMHTFRNGVPVVLLEADCAAPTERTLGSDGTLESITFYHGGGHTLNARGFSRWTWNQTAACFVPELGMGWAPPSFFLPTLALMLLPLPWLLMAKGAARKKGPIDKVWRVAGIVLALLGTWLALRWFATTSCLMGFFEHPNAIIIFPLLLLEVFGAGLHSITDFFAVLLILNSTWILVREWWSLTGDAG